VNNRGKTSGVVYVHSSPSAVCPHVEWAISGTLGVRADLRWSAQPAAPGQLRAECAWTGDPGTGAQLSGALKAWPMIRFEVTEDPSPGVDGERFCFAPGIGLWHARAAANGVDGLLGKPWDDALEPFRRAGDGAPVTWLHRVG
jgi:hypothetical protein